ncbi:hypothetical protein [Bifidobacterium margollesii]|nr:hypothetical protein [Bifidobacterium margollesii]
MRGDDADRVWAANAAGELRGRWHVSDDRVRRALEEQCGLLQEFLDESDEGSGGGRSLDELLGSPRDWAAERVEEWRESGIDAFSYDRPKSMREVMVTAMRASAPVYAVFWLMLVVGGWSSMAGFSMMWRNVLVPSPAIPGDSHTLWSGDGLFPLRDLFMPFVIVLAMGLVQTTYRRVLRGVSHTLAVLSVIALAVAVGLAGAMASEWLLPPMRVNAAWLLWMAAMWAVAGYVVGWLWKEPLPKTMASESSPFVDDATWIRDVGRLLRERGDITDGTARRICEEAKDFSSQTGLRLAAEFGTPAEYAHRFRETSVRARREMIGTIVTMVMLTVIMGAALVLIVRGEWEGSLVPVVVQGVFYVIAAVATADSISGYRHASRLMSDGKRKRGIGRMAS